MASCLLCEDMLQTLHGLKLSSLLAICQVIDTALDLESALKGVLCIMSEQLKMQRATVTLLNPETSQLSIHASYGLSQEEKQRGLYQLDEGTIERIFNSCEPYFVPDLEIQPLFLCETGTRKIPREMISFIGVPILLRGNPIGTLNVDRLFSDDITFEEDVNFLETVATLIGQFMSLHEKIKEREAALKRENISLKYQISKDSNGLHIVGKSASMIEVQRQIEKVSSTRAAVLLRGESGVGKTLVARIIHELSGRKNLPFIKTNCASIPENMLESEFFGHEKDAFPNATCGRPGRFEEAEGGTIFLDEIENIPLKLQAKLLGVIQDKELKRLGSNHIRPMDVRILAATTRNLGDLVERGKFRLDLYYRLNVFPINIPTLRERKEDITRLLNHFIQKISNDYGRNIHFTPTALDALIRYDWPGNVREMQNLIERLAIMSDSDNISLEFLKSYLAPSQIAAVQQTTQYSGYARRRTSLKEFERNEILAALEQNNWLQYKAAHSLGLSARQIGYRVKKYGLENMIAEGRANLRRMKETGA